VEYFDLICYFKVICQTKISGGFDFTAKYAKSTKERGTNNLVILGQPFFHQTTLFFCE